MPARVGRYRSAYVCCGQSAKVVLGHVAPTPWEATGAEAALKGKAITRAFILLPFIILTLGIVYFVINGLMLKLAAALVPGFRVVGCLSAVAGSILLTIVDYVLNRIVAL